MHLAPGQVLDLSVRFDRRRAGVHARYSLCAGVGMQRVDGDGRYRLCFETLDGTPPREALLEALDALEGRVDGALVALGQQPEAPPRSKC